MDSHREQTGKKAGFLWHVYLLMFISAVLVSSSFIVGKALCFELDPVVLTFFRFCIAAILLFPYVLKVHGLWFSISLVCRSAVISGCLVLFFWAMFLALRYTSALNTSVIFTLVPSITGIYAFFLVNERLLPRRVFALGIGLVGALWVIFDGDIERLLHMQWNKGDLIFLGGCLAMGLYTVFLQIFYRKEPMVVMTFWILLTGCFWLLLFGNQHIVSVSLEDMQIKAVVGVIYLAVFTTVVTFWITQYAVIHIGSTKVMAYSYLYPTLVLAINFVLGKGLPHFQVLPGIVAVIIAMIISQY